MRLRGLVSEVGMEVALLAEPLWGSWLTIVNYFLPHDVGTPG